MGKCRNPKRILDETSYSPLHLLSYLHPMHDQEITDCTRPSGTSQTSKTMLIETTAQDSETDKKRQRKRKRRKSQNNSSGETTVANTRENSEERENDGDVGNEFPKRRPVRRKHGDVITGEDCEGSKSATLTQNEPSTSDNPNVDGLYIEDINPAPLPSNIVIPSPPIHNNQSLSDDNSEQTKLLLPAHVSVLGSTPVEILPDESDEDDKDYIKYLDYEVDRHVCQIFILFLRNVIECPSYRSFCGILKNLRTNP